MSTQIIETNVLKKGLRATWMAGDFGQIAKYSEPEAERFISRLSIEPGARVLDVACGTGNLAIEAARRRAVVTGLDIAPNLLAQARERARAARLEIRFDEGDAEALPYEDESFDLVVSMYGAMFAPHPQEVASELIRVCRPGGVIAMANWTPTGFVGQMLKLIAAYTPAQSSAASPLLWGDTDMARERFRIGVSNLKLTRRLHQLKYPFSVPETIEFFRLYYGPVRRAFEKLETRAQASLRLDLERLWSKQNRAGSISTRVAAEYLEVLAQRA